MNPAPVFPRRGLSPRVRGNHGQGAGAVTGAGSIPAGAGEPAADLDRVAEIVRRPMAVLQDRSNGTLVYVGRAADGRRLVKVVIRTGRTRDLKIGPGPVTSVPTNYVRTLGYEEPRSMRHGQWRLLDGSVEA